MSTRHDNDGPDTSKPYWQLSHEVEEEVEADDQGNQGDDEDMVFDE